MTPLECISTSPLNRKKAGFSLIEVCMALAIVAVVFVTLIGLLPTGMKIFDDASQTTAQTRIVSHLVSMLQSVDYMKFKSNTVANQTLHFYDVDGAYVDSESAPENGSEPRRVYAARIVDSTQNIPNTGGNYDVLKTASRVLLLMGRNDPAVQQKLKSAGTPAMVSVLINRSSGIKVQPVMITRMDAEGP